MRWWPCKATQHHMNVISNIQNQNASAPWTLHIGRQLSKDLKITRQIPQPSASRQKHNSEPWTCEDKSISLCHRRAKREERPKQKLHVFGRRSRSLYIFSSNPNPKPSIGSLASPPYLSSKLCIHVSHPNYSSSRFIRILLIMCAVCGIVFNEGYHTSFGLVCRRMHDINKMMVYQSMDISLLASQVL